MSTATLNLRPASPLARSFPIFLREARYEFVRLMRTRSFSFSVIGFPVVFYLSYERRCQEKHHPRLPSQGRLFDLHPARL